MSTSHPTAFPFCAYHRAKNNGTMQCAIEHFKAASNHDSNFDPWVVCIHGRECSVVMKSIPHLYPSQCSPVKAIYCPRTKDWSLSSAMEGIEHCTQQMEQALAIVISHSVTSSQVRGWCHSMAGMHAREPWRHAWEPNYGVRWTSWGQIRECWPKDGGWRASGGQINRQWRGKYVSWTFETGFRLPGSLAHTGPEHAMQKKSPQLKKQLNGAWM